VHVVSLRCASGYGHRHHHGDQWDAPVTRYLRSRGDHDDLSGDGRAWWVLGGGRAHLLAGNRLGGVPVARCGHLLPLEVFRHDRLPSRPLCQVCVTVLLLPDPPRFARKAPAGRWCAPESVPGGQPVSDPAELPDEGHHVAGDPPGPVLVPRWARCPTDRHLHLLAPAQAQAAGIKGHGRAGCGRLIPPRGTND
jgi:hypothetical protein